MPASMGPRTIRCAGSRRIILHLREAIRTSRHQVLRRGDGSPRMRDVSTAINSCVFTLEEVFSVDYDIGVISYHYFVLFFCQSILHWLFIFLYILTIQIVLPFLCPLLTIHHWHLFVYTSTILGYLSTCLSHRLPSRLFTHPVSPLISP